MQACQRPVSLLFAVFHGLAVLLIFGSAHATEIPVLQLLDPPVEYRADYVLTAARRSYSGTVIHALGRERRDFEAGGVRQVLILRRDIDQAAIIWPASKFYMASSFHFLAGLAGGLDEVVVDRRVIGHENVEHEGTTVYQLTGGFNGQAWMTSDGIVMRLEGTVDYQGKSTPIMIAVSNLRRVKADPAAFERPQGYFGIPFNLSK